MKLLRAIALTTCMIIFQPWATSESVEFRVTNEALQPNSPHVGLNLGVWTSWGAEQLSANVLKNPGFEGIVDRAIVIVESSNDYEFTDDANWLARPEGFWDGGEYVVLTGGLHGESGRIAHSGISGGLAQFRTTGSLAGLRQGDAIAVTRTDDRELPTQWWFSGDSSLVDLKDRRPGSDGVRSLRLNPIGNPSTVSSYLDAIGDRAGKLLPFSGSWVLSFWAKGGEKGSHLQVVLSRSGTAPFVNKSLDLSPIWKQYTWTMNPADTGPPGTIQLAFTADHAGRPVWLDDVSLAPASPDASGFRREVIETLQTLGPGYLRDWQGQLGDTWENRIAPQFARRSSRYRPGGPEATDYQYSLPQFLMLCAEVHADPWVVLSPTLSPSEWRQAGEYLSQAATRYRFKQILVEYGNENWNGMFRGAAIPKTKTLNEAADFAFAQLKAGAHSDGRLKPVVSGQFVNIMQVGALSANAPPDQLIGVGPYWAFQLNKVEDLFPAGYAPQLAKFASQHTIAIYEMNAHSVSGSMPLTEVNDFLEGAIAGDALAWHTIGALNAGVEHICIFTLAQFDTLGFTKQAIHLFGVTRDLAQANHLRPTGRSLALLNRAVSGDQHRVESGSEEVRVAAWLANGNWQLAVASSAPKAQRVTIDFPPDHGRLPGSFAGFGPTELIRVDRRGSAIEFDLPAYGSGILLP